MTPSHHCPCPEGCRDCEWTCPGGGACPYADDTETDEDEDAEEKT